MSAACPVCRWTAAALLWIALMLVGPAPATAQGSEPLLLRLTQADFVLGNDAQPPARGWVPVELPQTFLDLPQTGGSIGWYRIQFDLDRVPERPLVLLAQRVVTTAEFRLNGSLLNPGVRFEVPGGPAGTQMLHRPHWLVLPTGLLKPGQNELMVRLAGSAAVPAWISGISIGTPQALRGEYLLREIPQGVVPQIMLVLLLGALVLGVRLWWHQPNPLLPSAVATMLLWAASQWHYLMPDLPLPRVYMEAGVAAMWIAFHWALLTLLWRMSGQGWPWYPRALTIVSSASLAGAAAVLLTEPSSAMLGALMLPTTVLRCLSTVWLMHWAWRERTQPALLLAGSELLWFAGSVQLMLVVLDLIPPDPFMLTPGSGLPFLLVLLWLGARHLAQQQQDAPLQRQMAVLEERQRMMLDMHDGVGSQLVTALRLARRDDVPREELARTLQEALTDMRLIIDAQETAAQDLQSLVEQWKERNQSRLNALGPRLQWTIDALPTRRLLSPDQALQVLRILQEALSNAVQHAQAQCIRISLRPVPGGSELQIADDGTGVSAVAALKGLGRRGQGLPGMQRRAARLGALLQVQPGARGGTIVSLVLPVAMTG